MYILEYIELKEIDEKPLKCVLARILTKILG